MKLFLLMLLGSSLILSPGWELDFEKAKKTAREEHKYILVNFSGSDWCGPCIRMEKEIFDGALFTAYAKDHLILVNADFPRLKKHALSKEQQKKNEQLADAYDPQGIFPLTVLLNTEGKVVMKWEGLPEASAEEFTKQIQAATDAGK
ncbi:MAG: thioredoxin family protein [Bacteroidota bacterium]